MTDLSVDVLKQLCEQENLRDPERLLAWVRQNRPVHRAPGGFYLVATHAASLEVLRSPKFRAPDRDQLSALFPRADHFRSMQLLANTLVMYNPPEHTRLRRLFGRDFSTQRVDGLRPGAESICGDLLDRLAEPLLDGEVVDLNDGLSLPMAVRGIAELLGIPEADWLWLTGVVPAILAAVTPGATEAELERSDQITAEFEAYLADLIDARRRAPRGDLISAWVGAHDGGDRLSYEELISMLWGTWAGGFVTTATTVSHGLLEAIRQPGSGRWLAGDDRRLKAFAEEVARFDSPTLVAGIPRFAVRDVELAGVRIPEGSDVRPMLAAANRDSTVFPAADRFDPARDHSHTLAFGHGIHYCQGAQLVRMQLSLVLSAAYRRFPGLVLAEEPRWRPELPLRVIDQLRVALPRA